VLRNVAFLFSLQPSFSLATCEAGWLFEDALNVYFSPHKGNMRLLNVRTFEIEEFIGTHLPRYAILSYTWGTEEVTLHDWQDRSRASLKGGFAKIQGACNQAAKDKLDYIWVDTNCIDKTSSAELSEAINSMFAWYRDASHCYVYLADTSDTARRLNSDGELDMDDSFLRSKWFTRGWTLQELLAPQIVIFFSMNWKPIGTKIDLKTPLSQITGIGAKYLTGGTPIWRASVAKRMSWISKRVTTRIEDIAYCLMGIFEINMPLLYGEGQRAFFRLQEEILKVTDDQSIFCWEWNQSLVVDGWASILAPSPAVFKNSGEFFPTSWDDHSDVVPYNITNAGLSIKLPLIQTANQNFVFAVLQVRQEWVNGDWGADYPYSQQICIPLEKARIHRRLPFPEQPIPLHMAMTGTEENIYIHSRTRSLESSRGYIITDDWLQNMFDVPNFDIGFLLTFKDSEADLCYSTSDVTFLEGKGVLAFSFGGRRAGETFAAGIFNVSRQGMFKITPEGRILLAIRAREEANGTLSFSFYCQAIPNTLNSAISRGLPLSEIVREVENRSLDIGHDIDFSSNGFVAVALGVSMVSRITGSSSHITDKQVTRVAHIIVAGRREHDALKEDADSSFSLFGHDYLERFAIP
jgi:hypothetical protein